MMRVTRKGVGAVPEPWKCGGKGEGEMNRYRDEDANRECERIETVEEVESRFGVPYDVVTRYLRKEKGWFMALNPHTNVRMIVGELPDAVVGQYAGWRRERGIWQEREAGSQARSSGSGNPLAFLWYGPTDWLELVLWILVLPLSLVLQVARFILWVSNEFDRATGDIGCCKNYDAYAGGDGLFDAVNDMRRSDIVYLLGGRR